MNDISLRDTIAAAMTADAEAQATEVVETPASSTLAAGDALDVVDPIRPEGEAAPVRDASGKFAAKADPAAAAAQEPAAQPANAEPPVSETIPVPPGLPPALKAKFKDLPAEWRDAFVRQEDSFKAAKVEWAPKGERLNRLEALVAPRRGYLATNGLDEFTWIERLSAAEQVLIENPVQGILHLARAYGADLRQIAAQMTGGQSGGQPAPTMDPNLQSVLSEFQTLKQAVTQQQQGAQEAQAAQITAQITSFANDPAHLYFQDVKDDIAALLQSGRATDLKDAYDKAVWANPEIRELMLKEHAAKSAQPDPQAAARAKAAAAANAAGSVTGAARLGSGPAGGADPNNLRETIRAAYDEAAGRV